MKRVILSAAIAAGLGMLSLAAKADSYLGKVILTQDGYSSGYGGEFRADLKYAGPPAPFNVIGGEVGVTFGPSTPTESFFRTFCIEQGLHDRVFYPGHTYDGYLVDQITPADPWTHLESATAALYDAFYQGGLAGYNYGTTNNADGLSRAQTAGALQAAIWFSQHDDATLADAIAQSGIQGNAVAKALAQTFYNFGQNPVNAATHTVQVISLRDGNGNYAQAQLIETTPLTGSPPAAPLPPTAVMGALMLGGLGLVTTLRKRRENLTQTA